MSEDLINGCVDLGVHIFRINLSHTPLDAVAPTIGGFPVEAVTMIRNLIDESEMWTPDTSLAEIMGS